jgi:hypothetical protein
MKKTAELGELIVNEDGSITTTILDQELDTIEVKFNGDSGVEINTEDYSYINLSKYTLIKLYEMVDKAERMYDEIYDEMKI